MPTHAVKFASFSDEIILMKKGRITQKGAYKDICYRDTLCINNLSEMQSKNNGKHHIEFGNWYQDDESSSHADAKKTFHFVPLLPFRFVTCNGITVALAPVSTICQLKRKREDGLLKTHFFHVSLHKSCNGRVTCKKDAYAAVSKRRKTHFV